MKKYVIILFSKGKVLDIRLVDKDDEHKFVEDSKYFKRGYSLDLYDSEGNSTMEELAEYLGVYPERNGEEIALSELYDGCKRLDLIRRYSNS